jgi:LPS export ABC transporter protein LptC
VSPARPLRLRTIARRVLLAALVAAAVGGTAWFRGLERGENPTPPAAVSEAPGDAEMVTRDFRHVETRMDRTMWILEAKRAVVRKEMAHLTAVKITWYGEAGTVPVVITSDAGRIDFGRRRAVLDGHVRAERADGTVLETERLAFNERRRVLHAPLPVVISAPAFTFRGSSLTANVATRSVRLNGRVEGEIRGGSSAARRNS